MGNEAARKNIEELYSDMEKRYYSAGMYISMFQLAKRLDDKRLETKAIRKEAEKFSRLGFEDDAERFLKRTGELMEKGDLDDIGIQQIELDIMRGTAEAFMKHYLYAKKRFDNASGRQALREAKRLVFSMYIMGRLDLLHESVSAGWEFPFAGMMGKNWYAERESFIEENFKYKEYVCPRIASIVESFDFKVKRMIKDSMSDLEKLLKKSGVDGSRIGILDTSIRILMANAGSGKEHMLNVLSDLSEENMKETMHTIGNGGRLLTKMYSLWLSVNNLKEIAEKGDRERAEDIIESMQQMAMWRSSDLHSFERLLSFSKPRKGYGRQTNLERYFELLRK